MEIQEEEQLDLGNLVSGQGMHMLSDPESPDNEEYEMMSTHEKELCSPEKIKQEVRDCKEMRTPTKSSSTEVEGEASVLPYFQETRHDKLRRYLQKRNSRNWCRKVSYDCRKKVADSRLRIKGRFITRAQAEFILGEPLINFTPDEIKLRLERHFADLKTCLKMGSADLESKSMTIESWRKCSLASHPE